MRRLSVHCSLRGYQVEVIVIPNSLTSSCSRDLPGIFLPLKSYYALKSGASIEKTNLQVNRILLISECTQIGIPEFELFYATRSIKINLDLCVQLIVFDVYFIK